MFQMTFAIITPALVVGAYAERVRFSRHAAVQHAVADSRLLPRSRTGSGAAAGCRRWACMDFAGGLVVHLNAGVAALVCALVLGRRRGFPDTPMPPHNLDHGGDGRVHAVGGLVRLQRRQRAGRRRRRRHGDAGHPHRRGDRFARLDARASGCATASRRCSASSPAWWRGSAPSRRPPASSVRSARWSSARPPAWCASPPPTT